MDSSRSLEQFVLITRCVVRESDALFGYVFELTPDSKQFLRGRPLVGSIQEEQMLRTYYKPIGERVLELLAQGQDQAVPVEAPADAGTKQKSWFAAIITQDLGLPVCAAVIYPFYDRSEAIKTLRLVEMIMTTKPLR